MKKRTSLVVRSPGVDLPEATRARPPERPNLEKATGPRRRTMIIHVGKWMFRYLHVEKPYIGPRFQGVLDKHFISVEKVIGIFLDRLNKQWCDPPLLNGEYRTVLDEMQGIPVDQAPNVNTIEEVESAHLFTDLFRDTVRFDQIQRRWLVWGKHHWLIGDKHPNLLLGQAVRYQLWSMAQVFGEEKQKVLDRVLKALEEERADKDTVKVAISGICSAYDSPIGGLISCASGISTKPALASMMSQAGDLKPISDDGTRWNERPNLLCCANGIVDLRDGSIRPGVPEDRITQTTGINFVPGATMKEWDEFLLTALDEDAALISWLQRVAGYSATGECSVHLWCALIGSGRNGKGVFCRGIVGALGGIADPHSYAVRINVRAYIAAQSGNKGRQINDRAFLEDRRFAATHEFPQEQIDAEFMKEATGGDGIVANHPYARNHSFRQSFHIWVTMNTIPLVADESDAFWLRVKGIRFPFKFVSNPQGEFERQIDFTLDDKFASKEGKEAILAWLVRGTQEFYKDGLGADPPNVEQTKKALEIDADGLGDFVVGEIEHHPDGEMTSSAAYERYVLICDLERIPAEKRLKKGAFERRLAKRFPKQKCDVGPADARVSGYKGLRLRKIDPVGAVRAASGEPEPDSASAG